MVRYRSLDCGILYNGFARVRCGECGHEYLLAYETDPLCCPKCQGRMRIVAYIEDKQVIERTSNTWDFGIIKPDHHPKQMGHQWLLNTISTTRIPRPPCHRLGIRALRGSSPQFQPASCPHNIMRSNLTWHTKINFPILPPEKQILIKKASDFLTFFLTIQGIFA